MLGYHSRFRGQIRIRERRRPHQLPKYVKARSALSSSSSCVNARTHGRARCPLKAAQATQRTSLENLPQLTNSLEQ